MILLDMDLLLCLRRACVCVCARALALNAISLVHILACENDMAASSVFKLIYVPTVMPLDAIRFMSHVFFFVSFSSFVILNLLRCHCLCAGEVFAQRRF